MKNNTIKQKSKYLPGEMNNTPIHTAENCSSCECGEISRDLAEFTEEHTPEKTIKKKK